MIGLIYNQPIDRGGSHWESSADVLIQVEAIENSLTELGLASVRLPVSRDLRRFLDDLDAAGIDQAFNLCESLTDDPFFVPHPAAVLELLGIPFTGSSSAALQATTDKQLMKMVLRGAGIPTPASVLFDGSGDAGLSSLRLPVIAKPRCQDASIGIDQDSIIESREALPDTLARLHRAYGPLLVEEYIEGREFNLSLLGKAEPEAMPVAEIDFSSLPDRFHRIVGYRAKWEPDSIEYQATRRVFPELEPTLVNRMGELSRRCYALFGLRDYGRIDLRLGDDGSLWVLEINANPCLSPDAGFPAAVAAAGRGYTELVAGLVRFLDDHSS